MVSHLPKQTHKKSTPWSLSTSPSTSASSLSPSQVLGSYAYWPSSNPKKSNQQYRCFPNRPPPNTHTHKHTPHTLFSCCCLLLLSFLLLLLLLLLLFCCCCCCCYCYCFAVASAGVVSSSWSASISTGRVLNHTRHSLTLISSHHQQAFFTQQCHWHFYFKTVQTDQVLLCPDIYLWFDDYDVSFWHDLQGWVGAKQQE